MSQAEIARELQVSEASISLDIQYLRNQAKESIRNMSEHLPEQYQICLNALDTILKHAFEISETSDYNKAVILIEKISVDPEEFDLFLKAWAAETEMFKEQPGFISTHLYKGIGGSGTLIIYAI